MGQTLPAYALRRQQEESPQIKLNAHPDGVGRALLYGTGGDFGRLERVRRGGAAEGSPGALLAVDEVGKLGAPDHDDDRLHIPVFGFVATGSRADGA